MRPPDVSPLPPPGQLSVEHYSLPFGGKLTGRNRWVKLAELIPWEELEGSYAERFKYQDEAPFDASLLVHCRKRLNLEIVSQVNEVVAKRINGREDESPSPEEPSPEEPSPEESRGLAGLPCTTTKGPFSAARQINLGAFPCPGDSAKCDFGIHMYIMIHTSILVFQPL